MVSKCYNNKYSKITIGGIEYGSNKNKSFFLKELEYLSEKYQIKIGGCGCCCSPWLKDLKYKKYIGYNLEYIEEKRVYIIELK